jgi:hypothetical protein
MTYDKAMDEISNPDVISDCQHNRLAFGSGDYYIFCQDCSRSWMMCDSSRAEYGNGPDGNRIGGVPELANGERHPGYRVPQELVADAPPAVEPPYIFMQSDIDPGACWCWQCEDALQKENFKRGIVRMARFIVCPTCGNKRCPRAASHEFLCTGSNETDQVGVKA